MSAPTRLHARRLAVEAVIRVTRDGLALQWDDVRLAGLDERDRAMVREIATGSVRHLTLLDALLAACMPRPLARGRHFLHAVLRTALYQALFLRIPARAAIHQAVEMVKESPEHPKAGFVNALLRRAVTLEPEAVIAGVSDPLTRLAVRHSHPEWMVRRWCREIGVEAAEARMIANNRPAPLTVRVHGLKTTSDRFLDALEGRGALHPCAPEGVIIADAGSVEALPGYREGWFAVQDGAAQWPARLLDPRPGESVLDLCAAPGGKSAQLADLTKDQADILAVDLSAVRLQRLAVNLERLGIQRVGLLAGDATQEGVLGERRFQRILADLPCSGTGVIRRHPEIKWRRQESDPARMAVIQQVMLANAARHLLPGGMLVYAVCSLEPEEGVAQIERFLQDHPGWSRLPVQSDLSLPASAITAQGDIRFDPACHPMDGFFISRLCRPG